MNRIAEPTLDPLQRHCNKPSTPARHAQPAMSRTAIAPSRRRTLTVAGSMLVVAAIATHPAAAIRPQPDAASPRSA